MIGENATSRVKRQLEYLMTIDKKIIIDADTHISNIDDGKDKSLYYHGKAFSVDKLIHSMDINGIDMSLCWQNPAFTEYFGNDYKRNFTSLLNSNKYIYESALKYPERIIPAGWTDPKGLGEEAALDMIDVCIQEFGFCVIKINPAQNEFMINSPQVKKLVKRIIEQGAIPAFHFGADTCFTPVEGLRDIADTFKDSLILGVHAGGGGASYMEAENHYQEVLQLGKDCKNILFIESAKRDTHIKNDLLFFSNFGKTQFRNLAWASDFPYGNQGWNYRGFLGLIHELEEEKLSLPSFSESVLGGNLKEILIDVYKAFLK